MKITSFSRFILIAVAVTACTCAVRAQETVTDFPSAKVDAIERAGIVAGADGSPVVARAVYVKLRRGATSGTSATAVQALAERAGLRATMATPVPFTQMPVSEKDAERIGRMSQADRVAIQEAVDDLARIVELGYDNPIAPADAARMIAAMPGVEYAEPIPIPHILEEPASVAPPNDPFLAQQTHLSQLKVLQAWEIWKGDSNLTIGIVDDGVDMAHQDLAPSIKENSGEVGVDSRGRDKRTNRVDDDGNGVIDDWRAANLTAGSDGSTPGDSKGGTHGTTVAGLASATVNNGIGVAGTGYRCRMFPIKTALKSGGLLIRPYEGIIYAANRGFKVINCSFGGTVYVQALQDIITDLVRIHDCAIVAAAGNDVAYSNFYPAGYDHVLGVGALNASAGFTTTWGEQVDVSSFADFSTGENDTYSGVGPATSFATPVVSGIMGLVRSKFPSLTSDQAAEHIRLTSDPLALVPDKVKLTGYGRVNAQRAVSTDPFSHPAILVDSVWMTDLSGNPMDRAAVGRFAKLRLRLKNILGNATNVQVRVATYNADSASLLIRDTTLTLTSLNTNEAKSPDGGVTFQLKQPNGARLRFRVSINADGNYADYRYRRMLFYIPYTTYSSENITLSLTDHGRVGFEDFPDNIVGEGLRYTGVPFLYEGGLMVASDPFRTLSNIRSSDKQVQRNDFSVLEYPNAANNFTLTLSDAGTGDRKIGVEMRVRVLTSDTVPDGIAIQVRTKYVGANLLDSLRTALFLDWDLDSSEIGQTIDYHEAPKTNVPFYGIISGETGYYVAEGVGRPYGLPIFFAIRNDSLPMKLFEGFGDDKKWFTLSNGIGSRRAPLSDSSDVSLVLGRRLARLIPGVEDTTLYVIGIGTDQNDAVAAMRSMAPPYKDTSATVGVGVGPGGARLADIRPNPFNGTATIRLTNVPADATLRVFDQLGRLVADLTEQLNGMGTDGETFFNAQAMPSGLYQVQLAAKGAVETRHILLVR